MADDGDNAFGKWYYRTSPVRQNPSVPLQVAINPSEVYEGGTTIDDLPDELILEIFSYISFAENVNILQEVSTRWQNLAQDAHLWLHRKYIVRYPTTEEEAIATFASVPHLRTLILEKEVTPTVFEALSRSCPNLTSLETTFQQMLTHSEAHNLFNGCKKIRKLTISDKGLWVDERFLDAVAQLSDLRVLHLLEYEHSRKEIPLCVLADGCPHLCDLELGRYHGISYRIQDAEYFIRSHKNVLENLSIRWTSIEGRSVAPLLSMCADVLQCLELKDYQEVCIEEAKEAFCALGQLHNLRQLHLHVNDLKVRHLVPAIFEHGRLLKLQQLRLSCTVVDEVTRAVAEHCPELRELELHICRGHTDTLFEPLRQLRKLEKLKIYHCKCLGGKAMSYIAKLPALHTLDFALIQFDKLKPSVDCILEMSGLRRLYLSGSICFAIPFEKFPGRLVNLRELEIDCCDGDQEVLERVRAQLPNLRVEGSFGDWITDDED